MDYRRRPISGIMKQGQAGTSRGGFSARIERGKTPQGNRREFLRVKMSWERQREKSHGGRTLQSQRKDPGGDQRARTRAESGAAQGNNDSARARGPLRERRVQVCQGAAGVRLGAAGSA